MKKKKLQSNTSYGTKPFSKYNFGSSASAVHILILEKYNDRVSNNENHED